MEVDVLRANMTAPKGKGKKNQFRKYRERAMLLVDLQGFAQAIVHVAVGRLRKNVEFNEEELRQVQSQTVEPEGHSPMINIQTMVSRDLHLMFPCAELKVSRTPAICFSMSMFPLKIGNSLSPNSPNH